MTTDDSEMLERELAQVKECFDIITFQHNGQKYGNPQEARIKPNQRLAKVFGIENVFTHSGSKQFSKVTTKKMRAACHMRERNNDDKGDWTTLRERAMEYVQEYLRNSKNHAFIILTDLVQFITLKLSLSYLFDDAEIASKTQDTFEDIIFIGHEINKLWIASKKPESERPQWTNQHKLHESLRRVTTVNLSDMPGSFPQEPDRVTNNETEPTVPARNPMNFLLPAYETMWRVVLRCLIEIHFRNATNSSVWRLVLANYLTELSSPTCMPEAFHRASETGLRPSDITKEALRLYPPSRHVHRDFDGELYAADIEACHRSTLLGGDDPLVFRPERWLDICPDERAREFAGQTTNASMQALKKATRAFAMKMVVMLVAVLSDGLGDEWAVEDGDSLPRLGAPLESDRAAYGDLRLRRM